MNNDYPSLQPNPAHNDSDVSFEVGVVDNEVRRTSEGASHLRRYSAYKDSGVPWLGEIPAHWELRKTKYLFQERSEKGFPDEPLLAATQTKGVVRKEEYENRTVLALKDLDLLKLVRAGDFVISLRSFQGGIEFARHQGIISPAYTVLYPVNSDHQPFYGFLFKSRPYVQNLSLFVTGIRQGQNIDYQRLKNSLLPVPPPDEQRAIARFLDAFDRLTRRYINAQRRLIALLTEQKQALIQQAVTRGLDPDVPLKDSGIEWLGEIPAHWEIIRCGYLFREIADVGYPDTQLLSIDRFKGIIPQDETGRKTRASLDRKAYKRVRPGQLAYNLMNAFMGALGFSQYDGIVSPAYAVAQPLREIETRYFHLLLRTSKYTGEYNRLSYGIMYERNRLYFERFKLVRALLPPLSEQKAIADWIESETQELNVTIERIQRQIELVREYRTRLIADVVTGKLDVRGIEVGHTWESTSYLDLEDETDFEENAEEITPDEEVLDE
jgi:type I restriction enzyme S subunit